jgi:hypothetical protein
MAASRPSERLTIISAARWGDVSGLYVIWLKGGDDAPAAVGLTKIAVQVILGLSFATVPHCAAAIEMQRSAIEDRINEVYDKPDDARSAGIVFFTRQELTALEADKRPIGAKPITKILRPRVLTLARSLWNHFSLRSHCPGEWSDDQSHHVSRAAWALSF